MEQKLMLVDKTLPLTAKEIQIPGKELNSIQKSQYLKNVESTRNEIIKKIDVCLEFQKEQYLKEERNKLIAKLNNGNFKKLLDKFNDTVSKRQRILMDKVDPLNEEIKAIYHQIGAITKKDKFIDLPLSNDDSKIEKCEEQKPEDFISDYECNNDARERYNKTKANLFENKKKLVQTQYKILVDAILYYKVDRFKKLLIDFLKTRNEINKVYVPIINNKPNVINAG